MSKRNRRRKQKISSFPPSPSRPTPPPPSSGLQSCGNEFEAAAARIMASSQKRRQEEVKAQVQQSACAQASLPQSEIVLSDSERPKESKLGEIVRLPATRSGDGFLRLEQNLGCEFPVCASNRSDVNKQAIEIRSANDVLWRLERTASSLLPAPEHHVIWLWLLNKFQEAARQGCIEAPRIVINLVQMAKDLGRTPNGQWYRDVDEALSRFSRMVITAGQSLHVPGGHVVSNSGAFGTLCNYVSWRTESPKERETLIEGAEGWVQPGPFVWDSIRSGYLKAVPLLPMQSVRSYVSQRLFLYLSKHCQTGCCYKVSVNKLLPKIPMKFSKNVKEKLIPHHKALLALGFLASEPVYEGRGVGLMVTYERAAE